jgi:hypothetical protein
MTPQLCGIIPEPARMTQPAGAALRAAGGMLQISTRTAREPGRMLPARPGRGPESGRTARASFRIVGGITRMLHDASRATPEVAQPVPRGAEAAPAVGAGAGVLSMKRPVHLAAAQCQESGHSDTDKRPLSERGRNVIRRNSSPLRPLGSLSGAVRRIDSAVHGW